MLAAAHQAVDSFAAAFADLITALRKPDPAALCRHHPQRQRRLDGLAAWPTSPTPPDWRVEYPFVVLCPDTEEDEIAHMVKARIELA